MAAAIQTHLGVLIHHLAPGTPTTDVASAVNATTRSVRTCKTSARARRASGALATASLGPQGAAAMAGTNEDELLVRNVLQDYIDGTFEGDAEKLKACFHPDAIMNGFIGSKLQEGTPQVRGCLSAQERPQLQSSTA